MTGQKVDPKTGMIVYRPGGEVLRRFIADDAPVTIIQGPWGSGKSAGCCLKLWKYMVGQAPQADGIRRTRWCVARNSYPELQATTLKTWLDWFPEARYGRLIRQKPFIHEIRLADVEADVWFFALDDEEDRKKLLSLEVTGFWFNEMREIPKGIIDDATGRLRYPAVKDGGATWKGVIGDTNAPSEDHWLPIMRGDVPPPEHMDEEKRRELVKPDSWKLYVQPPAMIEEMDERGEITGYRMNPEAENVSNLPEGYYEEMIKGKSKSWIDVNVLNKLGRITAGKPVWPMYRPALHLAKKPIDLNPNLPLLAGVDFGRQPAVVFGQCLRGEWAVIHELIARDMGATSFAPILKREIAQRFPEVRPERVQFWGDPAGDDMTQSDDKTPFQIFRQAGLIVRPAPCGNNRLNIRLEAVEAVLNRLVDGKPALVISPRCTMLKAAMDGGYKYRRLHTSAERYAPEPEKDQFSHVADALQYLLLGGGENVMLVMGGQKAKPVNVARRASVLSRGR